MRPSASHAAGDAAFLMEVYRRLLERFGPQGWWPARTPFEVIIGAILTQSVAWTNVERAIAALDGAGLLSPGALAATPAELIAPLIRPAGYYNAKARKLKAFVDYLYRRHDGRLECLFALPPAVARSELLAVHGIGPETADSILLYAGGLPTFVVDAYTVRILSRLRPGPPAARSPLLPPPGARPAPPPGARPAPPPSDGYEAFRRYFMNALPGDPALFNEYHALLVALGKDFCRKRDPRCPLCPLLPLCPTGQTV